MSDLHVLDQSLPKNPNHSDVLCYCYFPFCLKQALPAGVIHLRIVDSLNIQLTNE